MYGELTFSYLDVVHEHAVERYSDCMEDSPFSYLDVVHEHAVERYSDCMENSPSRILTLFMSMQLRDILIVWRNHLLVS